MQKLMVYDIIKKASERLQHSPANTVNLSSAGNGNRIIPLFAIPCLHNGGVLMFNPNQLSFDDFSFGDNNPLEFPGLVPSKERLLFCVSCKTSKPISAFTLTGRKNGDCRECVKNRVKAWEERNKAKNSNNPIAITNKKCAICKRVLPVSYFTLVKASKHGVSRLCRECKAVERKEYYTQTGSAVKKEKYNSDVIFRERCIMDSANRRAKLKGMKIPIALQDWLDLKESYGNMCVYCGFSGDTIKLGPDHIEPLGKGGNHVIENIVPCCPLCNSAKQDRSLLLFLGWKNGLLQ